MKWEKRVSNSLRLSLDTEAESGRAGWHDKGRTGLSYGEGGGEGLGGNTLGGRSFSKRHSDALKKAFGGCFEKTNKPSLGEGKRKEA